MDDFQILVKSLSDVLGPSSGIDSDDVDPQQLMDLMNSYTSVPTEWHKYSFSDPGKAYTRNLVDEGNGKSNLLILVWQPGKSTPIHDHANAHCVMKILHGSLTETLYCNPSQSEATTAANVTTAQDQRRPQPVKQTIYSTNQTTYISDSIGLHKISNPSTTEIAVSLHLYTPPHAANFGFNIFEPITGRKSHIKNCPVYSRYGKQSSQKADGAGSARL